MNVPAKKKAAGRYFTSIVAETKGRELPQVFMKCNASTLVPFGAENIVVSPHEDVSDVLKIFAPAQKPIKFGVHVAMKHIAHGNDLPRLKILQQGGEALQVVLVDLLRNRNAGFSKMPCFAKVKIGHDERLFLLPINGPFGGKPKRLVQEFM